jgi:hypothetical protein
MGFVNAKGFLNAKPAVFAPALIEEVDSPVRERSPYQPGKRIDDAAELVLHCRSFLEVAAPRGCTTPSANVHHTLVSVCSGTRGDFDGNDGTFRSSRMEPSSRTAEVDFRRRASHCVC